MTMWKKVMGNGVLPLYFDRDSLDSTFGRFCIQPLHADSAAYLAESLRRTMFEALPGAAVIGLHFRLNRSPEPDSERNEAVLTQVKSWLKELRITTAARFPLMGRIRRRGPGLIVAGDVKFNVPVQIAGTSSSPVELFANESLEIDFLFHWGKGRILAAHGADLGLPRGWLALDASHSPVRRCEVSATVIDVGPNKGRRQLIAEVTTDGTLSPEDAVRRAGNYVGRPPQPLAG